MANIKDYLRWRGDLTLAERTFNDADNLIMSTLCYLDFAGIVPEEGTGESVDLGLACLGLLDKAEGDVSAYVRSLAKIDTEFLQLLASSKRFGEARLHDYADVVDEARSLQFSALQIDLTPDSTYVAFRGTDSTLVGWREDFMLSFEVTEAQREADRYLRRALRRAEEEGRYLLVGGHSKGGNLSAYAATVCPEELRPRIARVYSNDGPGMAPEVRERWGADVLGSRYERTVPSYSVVGMLFERPGEPRTVVESCGQGIGEHDPMTWQVTREGIVAARDLQPDCKVLQQAISSWLKDVSLQEREAFVDELFDALGAGGAQTLSEIASTPEGIQKVLAALGEADEQLRPIARALVDSAVSTTVDAARTVAQETADNLRKNVRSAAEDAARWIIEAGSEAIARGIESVTEGGRAQDERPDALPDGDGDDQEGQA